MLVCHEHRFIYIQTHKTASTSTAITLSQFCGPMDVIPKLDEEGESIRCKKGIYPRNYLASLQDYTASDFLNVLIKRGQRRFKRKFRPHMPANEIRPLVGEGIWKSYFKFTFDRNPWDRQVSHYYFNTRKMGIRPKFEDWVQTTKRARLGNFEQYAIDGEVVVDYIGKYENLEADIVKVLAKIGIKNKIELPKAKSNYRNSQQNYKEYYTDETRDLVRDWYSDEIKTLSYEF